VLSPEGKVDGRYVDGAIVIATGAGGAEGGDAAPWHDPLGRRGTARLVRRHLATAVRAAVSIS